MRVYTDNLIIARPVAHAGGRRGITADLQAGIPVMVRLHILNNVVIAADKDAVVSGSFDFQTLHMPVMAEDL
ncbi:hypothetical protein D3C80_1869870 [compost metagenome]